MRRRRPRRALQTRAKGCFGAILFGALVASLTQSSSATAPTVVGLVAAGPVGSSRVVSVPMGATCGATAIP